MHVIQQIQNLKICCFKVWIRKLVEIRKLSTNLWKAFKFHRKEWPTRGRRKEVQGGPWPLLDLKTDIFILFFSRIILFLLILSWKNEISPSLPSTEKCFWPPPGKNSLLFPRLEKSFRRPWTSLLSIPAFSDHVYYWAANSLSDNHAICQMLELTEVVQTLFHVQCHFLRIFATNFELCALCCVFDLRYWTHMPILAVIAIGFLLNNAKMLVLFSNSV